MKNAFIILGNGFTIDFLKHFNEFRKVKKKPVVNIDVQNLFSYGDQIKLPGDRRPGFLSYKLCPALWTLGARPNLSTNDSNALIEEIISCANMFFDYINTPNTPNQRLKRQKLLTSGDTRIYINAYCELIEYLRYLFSWYDSLITKEDLQEFIKEYKEWGWLKFFQKIDVKKFHKFIFVTYNYDIWLERILNCLNIRFEIQGFNKSDNPLVKIIKPHGSISFVSKNLQERYSINYSIDGEDLKIDAIDLQYDNLMSYSGNTIIPPSGDSSRMNSNALSWSMKLRTDALDEAKNLSSEKDSTVIICGISYWHVDRKEIDNLLINLNPETELTFINPNPPRDLNAVLMSIFKNYVLQTSSDNIGVILNG